MRVTTSVRRWRASSSGAEVDYRRLGASGLKVSALSYGSWITFAGQTRDEVIRDCLVMARDAGVNLFDTAETYAGGRAEELLGRHIYDLGWPRATYILSTKLYWGLHDWPHLRNTLNRKYLLQGIDGCLDRLRTSFVDILLCHRRDPETPIDEVVWTMSDIVASGKALYWGTSEWPPDDIRAACAFADRLGLRRPLVEQPEYNLFARRRVENDYRDLGLGLVTWSPLASGLLSGKYRDGVPVGTRSTLPGYEWLGRTLTDPERNQRVVRLGILARELGCSAAQLSIAWCLKNPAVSSVIIGASGPPQLTENLRALDIASHLDPDTISRIEQVFV